jgi:hypothetical protein
MTDAPELIWAIAEDGDFPEETPPDIRAFACPDGLVDTPTKYIRADAVAGRIKYLTAERDELRARLDAAEANMAKSVEALERIEVSTDTREQGAIAMATLAELTGGKDD